MSFGSGTLALFVGLDVVLEMNPRIEGPILFLRFVLEVNLGECHRHGLRACSAAGVRERDAGDDDVVHLDDKVLLLTFARLAMCDGGLFYVRTRSTSCQQARRGFVDAMNERKILEGRLACAATAAGLDSSVICDTPGERQHLDLFFVFGIDGLPLMSPIFAKMSDAIGVHLNPSPLTKSRDCSPSGVKSKGASP